MTNTEIVRKLIGEIKPIGKTEVDNERFKNIESLSALVENLLMDIDDVAYTYKDSQEFSVKRAADFARKFLENRVGIFKQNQNNQYE